MMQHKKQILICLSFLCQIGIVIVLIVLITAVLIIHANNKHSV